MQLRMLGTIPLLAWFAMACGSDATGGLAPTEGEGGNSSSGKTSASSGGSSSATGGASAVAGRSNAALGGSSPTTGETNPSGGGSDANAGGTSAPGAGGASLGGAAIQSGGRIATGGTTANRGGTSSNLGGTTNGGTTNGGTTSGRTATGGRTAGGNSAGTSVRGGASSGGRAAGGAETGSTGIGGTSAGGTSAGIAGGSGDCDWSTPASNVSAWIDESWKSELGSNVKNRKAWLIDNVMLGKGQINLCVRWGATSAPSAAVKSGMASAVEKWFNDWLSKLAGYGCFPYPTITTKVTGWAVKSGNTSWVSDLDNAVKIYTETDSDGEPKCSDSCSFFTNWSHTFPNCPGGEAFHHDYWLWLDDSISGGAAAVGGDWGLRMPVSNFVSAMGKSNLVIEHEMGHGFGFQDYYDWTGSTPADGSLMIVGSTSSQTPTTGDQWLLRRTWKEMKSLRGW